MNILGITQARIGSSRLPEKVLLKIQGKTLLHYHLENAIKSNLVSKWVVATTNENGSEEIQKIAEELEIECFKGKLLDVLDRFYQASKKYKPDYIVRVTSDCPLIDSQLIDEIVDHCIVNKLDYVSNTLNPTFPDGVDVEVFTFSSLEIAWREAFLTSDREHVTPFIWRNSTYFNKEIFKSYNFKSITDLSKYRLTVDVKEDLELITHLIEKLGSKASYKKYVDYLINNPKIQEINSFNKRNEGYMKSINEDKIQLRIISNFKKSDEYRKVIHTLIPGGAHTYSKGDDQFPQLSPAAISHGKGAYVWDIDGNQFLDCSMGLTSVSLGHAYEPVLKAVHKELENGVNFQRPSYIEKDLAERFLDLIPPHQMVKFAKNGSIVTTAAVKLARVKTGRKLVAFPSDHPFYSYDDWFIGKTECNAGVPEEVSNLSITYKSCDLESLKLLFEKFPNQIACVITEPERSAFGESQYGEKAGDYLRQAIKLTHENGALFIIDEMITGFKTDFPGSITKFNLDADLATWGKGIANGFSFCALTGKKEVMNLGGIQNFGSEKVFLTSTTHGGETHTLAAGLACIEEFKTKPVIKHNHNIGDFLIRQINQLIDEKKLQDYVEIIPCNWLIAFVFKDNDEQISLPFRTLIMQEMIRRGVLFQGAFVPCFSHTLEDINYFVTAFSESLDVYRLALKSSIDEYLIGESIKPVFRKYL